MVRGRVSRVWSLTDHDFEQIVMTSGSIADIVFRVFGKTSKGSNYKVIRDRIAQQGIDDSHIPRGKGAYQHKHGTSGKRVPIEQYLVEGSKNSRSNLKRRLLREKLIAHKCARCGNTGEWLGEPLVLQLDHINGVPNDNRLENLSLLCPNCHSQTTTYAGKSADHTPARQ